MRLLACPRCSGSLRALTCDACKVTYPSLDGVPWLFAEPKAKLVEWRNSSLTRRHELLIEEARIKAGQRNETLTPAGGRRLARLLQGTVELRKATDTLLESLIGEDDSDPSSIAALAARVSPAQFLMRYMTNIYRDWGWEETQENRLSHELVEKALAGTPRKRDILVLGAGAGRLAYDLHQAGEDGETVALDHNPLLALIAARMAAGKQFKLHEFPLAPKSLDDVAVQRKLTAPTKARAGFVPALGDALDPPVPNAAFDVVVAPWFFDVVPMDARALMAHINRTLKMGGRFVYFGSVVFQAADAEKRYGHEELLEFLSSSGFKPVHHELASIPYLASPASCQARHETVFVMSGEKIADVAEPEPIEDEIQALEDPTRPIPVTHAYAQAGAQHGMYAEVLALVDGKNSLRDIAMDLAPRIGVQADQLEPLIRSFLTKVNEQAGK